MGQLRADRIWQVSTALLALLLPQTVFLRVEVRSLQMEAARNHQANPRIGSTLRELPARG